MKPSAIFVSGVGLAVAAGLAFILLGVWKPGQASLPDEQGGSVKPMLAEAKKKTEFIRGAWMRVRGEVE